MPDSRASIERLFEHAPDSLLVALVDGKVVGRVIAAWDGWRGAVYRLAVSRPTGGVGLRSRSSAPARSASARSAHRASRRLSGRGNEPAERFWVAAGYARDESVGRFVRNL